MINKKPTRNFAALKNILILPVVAVLIAMFSFRQEPGFVQDEFQEPLLSETSQKEILRFLANNITYPQEAKASGDTGSVFVVLRMGKGGIINDAKAFTDKKGITVPIIKEIVILGYKMNSESGVTDKNTLNKEHPELKAECLRVVNNLGSIEVPEWKNKNLEFAIPFRFALK